MGAFGGLTVLEIAKDGKVKVSTANVSDTTIDDLQRNMLMFYTGTSRSSLDILAEQSKATKEDKRVVVDSLHHIKESGYKIRIY
jgi:D-glycero-alpha-D-manno-heptose-7-phosphate kinase